MSQLRVLDEREIDEDLDRRIKAGLCRCFPADVETFSKTRAWHGSLASYTVLIEVGGEVVGHVGVVRREILVNSSSEIVAGIQNVFITPEKRKTGLLEPLMRMAMNEAQRRQYDAGLLFCLPVLEKAYAKIGWLKVEPTRVIATRATGERYVLDDKNIAMFYPVQLSTFPMGEIDLNGDDW